MLVGLANRHGVGIDRGGLIPAGALEDELGREDVLARLLAEGEVFARTGQPVGFALDLVPALARLRGDVANVALPNDPRSRRQFKCLEFPGIHVPPLDLYFSTQSNCSYKIATVKPGDIDLWKFCGYNLGMAGRHKKTEAEAKSHTFRIRMTLNDRRLLDEAAKSKSLETSTWARSELVALAKKALRQNRE